MTKAVRSWGLDGGSVSIVTRHRRASSKMLGSLVCAVYTIPRPCDAVDTRYGRMLRKNRMVTRVGRVSMAIRGTQHDARFAASIIS